MTKKLLATICAAGLFAAAPSFANTSADTAPDRMPAATASGSAAAPMRGSAEPFGVWEGGQATQQAQGRFDHGRVAMQDQHAASTGRAAMNAPAALGTAVVASQGQPYQNGAAN